MDLKALMQKLETINKKEILTESEKKETTWTDKSGKKHPATQVKGDKYTGKEAEKDDKKSKKDDLEESFTSAIAKALVEEFGYELDEADPNDPNNTAAVTANTKTMQDARAAKDGTTNYTSGLDAKAAPAPNAAAVAGVTPKPQIPAAAPAAGVANPYTGADAAKFAALTPQDQAWLTKGGGKPDINDEIILSRAPNKGAPAAAPSIAKPAPETPAATTMTAADQDDADMGAAMRANAAQADAIKSGAQDDATGVDAAVAANAADDAKRAANPWPADKNAIIAFQKANGLTADGLIGPKTMAALQKSGATPPAGFKPAGAKAAAPAAQPAQKPSAAPAAQPAQKPGVDASGRANAAADSRIAGNTPSQPAAAPKPAYNAAKDSQAANTAPAATPAPAATFAQDTAARKAAITPAQLAGKKPQPTYEHAMSGDDQILAMIRNIRVS